MTSSNKIIPFKQETHHRAKSEFRLKTQISIYIRKEAEKFTIDCTSSNEDDTIEGILLILKNVLVYQSLLIILQLKIGCLIWNLEQLVYMHLF